ncbi:MAG TPA: aldehyde dehydrogenase family protein, partial [Bacteroidetes bacterium]|nr:aldehyde dehydrogenase family protein [Bacteroidota bacterium]
MQPEFKNQSFKDFSIPENKKQMEEELVRAEKNFGKEYDLYIGGKWVKSGDKFESINPSDKNQVIGVFQKASKKEADQAIEAGLKAFAKWKNFPAKERAAVLLRASQIMQRRRIEIDAWMVLEEGKNWLEADGDVAEAIDFLEFYAREMIRYSETQPVTPVPGEFPELVYIPLGVGAIIPPWNFPMAILAGMTSAAIVAGNAVILKPASDSPKIGHLFTEIMIEAGLPAGVLNFVPGSGASIGDFIVKHPKIRFISFTGSR